MTPVLHSPVLFWTSDHHSAWLPVLHIHRGHTVCRAELTAGGPCLTEALEHLPWALPFLPGS